MGKCERYVELGVEGLPGRLRRWLAQYLEVAENLSTKTRSSGQCTIGGPQAQGTAA